MRNTIDDEATTVMLVTPDMWGPAEPEAPRAERSSGPNLAALCIMLPVALAVGWWTGAEISRAKAPALTAPAAMLEQRATPFAAQPAATPDESIPVVAVADLPLEKAKRETIPRRRRAVASKRAAQR